MHVVLCGEFVKRLFSHSSIHSGRFILIHWHWVSDVHILAQDLMWWFKLRYKNIKTLMQEYIHNKTSPHQLDYIIQSPSLMIPHLIRHDFGCQCHLGKYLFLSASPFCWQHGLLLAYRCGQRRSIGERHSASCCVFVIWTLSLLVQPQKCIS